MSPLTLKTIDVKAALEAYLHAPSTESLSAAVAAIAANPEAADLLGHARNLQQAGEVGGEEGAKWGALAEAVLAELGSTEACLRFVAERLAFAARESARQGRQKYAGGTASTEAEAHFDRAARWATAAVAALEYLDARKGPAPEEEPGA